MDKKKNIFQGYEKNIHTFVLYLLLTRSRNPNAFFFYKLAT